MALGILGSALKTYCGFHIQVNFSVEAWSLQSSTYFLAKPQTANAVQILEGVDIPWRCLEVSRIKLEPLCSWGLLVVLGVPPTPPQVAGFRVVGI